MEEILKNCEKLLNWKPSEIEVKPLTGGLTNVLFTCENLKKSEIIVYRIYGELENRGEEVSLAKRLGDRDLSPKILASWENGRIEQFIPAKNLRLQDQFLPEIQTKIAQKLGRLHKTKIQTSKTPVLLPRIMDYVQKCNDRDLDLSKFQPYIDFVLDFLSKTDAETGFCHNDVHEGNILLNKKDRTINLIDYEYAAYNYCFFDIANHFCEWMFDYETIQDPFFIYIPNNFPSDSIITDFLYSYHNNQKLDETLVSRQIAEIKRFSISSHVFWALWALSICDSEINFNYLAFAEARINAMQKLLAENTELNEEFCLLHSEKLQKLDSIRG